MRRLSEEQNRREVYYGARNLSFKAEGDFIQKARKLFHVAGQVVNLPGSGASKRVVRVCIRAAVAAPRALIAIIAKIVLLPSTGRA
jgi:hypothetical protein